MSKKIKRLYLFLSLSLIAMMMFGCSKNDENKQIREKEVKCDHVWIEADCENPKRCEKCGEIEGESLGHTTDFGICERCAQMVNENLLYDIQEASGMLNDSVNSINEQINKINYNSVESAYAGVKAAEQYIPDVKESIDKYITVCEKSSKLDTLKTYLYNLKDSIPDELNSNDLDSVVASLENYNTLNERLKDVLLELNNVLEGLK